MSGLKMRKGIALAAVATWVAACAASGSDTPSREGSSSGDGDSGDGDASSSDGDSGGSTSSSSGGASSGDRVQVGFGGALGGSPGWLIEPPADLDFSYDPAGDTERDACVDLNIVPEEVFLDMFLILDRSGSMDDPFKEDSGLGDCDVTGPNNNSRWCNAIQAIDGFVGDPTSVNMGIAYGDFAFSDCDGFDLALPLDQLTPGDANGHIADLRAALNAAAPGSGTNTQGAVNALIKHTGAHIPVGKRKTVGILVTDGEPYLRPEKVQFQWQNQACDTETTGITAHLTALNAQLQAHFTATKIPTFVIGMDGVDAAYLELLAAGAGAAKHPDNCISEDECSYYSVGNGNPSVFISALEKIRRSVLGCEYALPSSQLGTADLNTLDVSFTPDTGEDALDLSKGDDIGACDTGADYWVDVTGADPVIHLCPAVCDLRGEGAEIKIESKCEGT